MLVSDEQPENVVKKVVTLVTLIGGNDNKETQLTNVLE
jgi:hypothetical protein